MTTLTHFKQAGIFLHLGVEQFPLLQLIYWREFFSAQQEHLAIAAVCNGSMSVECWIYSIDCGKEILHATQNQIIGTGELETFPLQKPAFALGERVILCSHDKGTKQRLILGIALVHNSWFYLVELMSPTLIKT